MKQLRSIKQFAEKSFSGILNESSRYPTYTSRLFEGIPSALPVEPENEPWARLQKDDKLVFTARFRSRESAKDFVSSVQELEDRMQHFVKIIVSKNDVAVEDSDDVIMNLETSKSFFKAINAIKESLDGR